MKSQSSRHSVEANMENTKDFVKLQHDELNISEIINLVVAPECGAISNFIGITRDNFENKKVLKLEYEAYEPMAIKEMMNICTKIRSQWGVNRIAIYHRLGEVPVSEASVVIAISSPHRQESLNAVEYAINTLKATVPIWKKEIYETEESQWKENQECPWSTKHNQAKIGKTIIDVSTQTMLNSTENVDTDQETSTVEIDPNIVQIQASSDELNNRIESFIARKRQQVNAVNIQEFCCHRDQDDTTEDSCARVDAILIRRKDSKSHVKVHRVLNAWGPQTVDQSCLRNNGANSVSQGSNTAYNSVLDERMSQSEQVLGIDKPVSKDVYERLKNIEDKILYLQGVCPEYKDFWITDNADGVNIIKKPIRKRTYSMAELNSKLIELEGKFVKRSR